jgi:hypothetical protein
MQNATIILEERNRQLLMKILTDHVYLDRLTTEERERYVVIVQTVALACNVK